MSSGRIAVPMCALYMAACGGQGEPLLTTNPPGAGTPVEFAVDLWPGEGIPVIELRRAVLPLRGEPEPGASVVDTLRGRPGQRVAFDSTRFQTVTTGSMRVFDSVRVTGRDMGDVNRVTLDRYYHQNLPEVSIPVGGQTTIDFLQHRAEGTCFVRIERRVIDAQPCPGFGRESVQVVRDPVTRWWIRVRGAGGAFGWMLVSDSTANVVRREF